MYLHTEKQSFQSKLSKVRAQTGYRHSRRDWIYNHASFASKTK